MSSVPVITIDGGAAVGKGTVAIQLAQHLGWHHLDSGLLYRLVAYQLLHMTNGNPIQIARKIEVSTILGKTPQDLLYLRDESIGKTASEISQDSNLRSALIDKQRACALPPGLIVDGRDMGTVLFPEAITKIFLMAKQSVVVQRRYKELNSKGRKVSIQEVAESIAFRDSTDSSRSVAPLKPADDAFIIDTSEITSNEVFKIIVSHLSKKKSKI